MVLCDNTATTATSLTCSSISGSAPWAVPGIVLRTVTGAATIPVISGVNASGLTGTTATITWTTDQASSSQVEYGTMASYGSLSTLSTTAVTSHTVSLSGLTAGTPYNYAVISTNAAGTATSTNFMFSTPQPLPVISAVTASGVTATTATITWTTDQASSSQVAFGTTPTYGSLSTLNATPVTSHTVTLTGLAPGTTYDYAVMSADAAGTATSGNFTFSTTATMPTISLVTSSGVTSTGATITWTTDQPSNSQVEFGTTASYGTVSTLNATPVTSHTVTLSGLTAGTLYNYAAMSMNAAGTATSGNFTFSTPVSAPGPTTFCFIGDSITEGFMSSPPVFPGTLMVSDLNAWTGTNAYAASNQGVGSTASGDWVSGSSNLTAAIANCAGLSTMFIMIGTNDSKNAIQTTPATYMSNVQSTITALEAAGFTKIVLNYSPWIVYPNSAGGFGSGSDALLMQYQTQLQTLAAADPTHVFIGDTAAFGYFQANPSQLADGVHPTNAGYAALAQFWATAALNIVGATLPVPVISGVIAGNVTISGATITWTTAQPSSSQVKYGTAASYGSLSTLNSSLVTSHSVTLSGLTPGTNYDYAVLSATPAGTSTSANFTFSTASVPLASTITVVGGARNNTATSTAPTSLSIPYSSSSGNTVVAVCALGNSSSSISSITDGGSIWTFQAGVNNGMVRSEIWSTGAGASVASTSFTINISGGTPASCALEEYAGVFIWEPSQRTQPPLEQSPSVCRYQRQRITWWSGSERIRSAATTSSREPFGRPAG